MTGWKRIVSIVLTGVVVGFLGLEFNLRVFGGPIQVFNPLNGFHEGDPVLGWRGKKGIARRFHTTEFDVLVRHDADGFREADPPRPPNARSNVLVLGDSLAWGWGVEQGQLFTDLLQRRLGSDVAVYNRAVNAYATGQEWLLFQRELELRDYDHLIVVVSATDMGDNADDKKHRPAYDLVDEQLVPRNQPPPGALKNPVESFIDDNSYATNFLSWQFAALKRWRQAKEEEGAAAAEPEPTGGTDLPPDAGVRGAATATENADRPTNGARTKPGFGVTQRLLEEILATAREHDVRVHLMYATTNLHLRHSPFEIGFRDLVRQIAERDGATFLDLNEPLERMWDRNEIPLIPGDGHWSSTGHEAVADLILESGVLSAREKK